MVGTESRNQETEDGAKEARLAYRCLKVAAGVSLLEIDLLTGRSHQIRVQLSSRGMPICGDAKYGSQTQLDGWLALHAASLTFDHPTLHEPITITAPHPGSWNRFRLGTTTGQEP